MRTKNFTLCLWLVAFVGHAQAQSGKNWAIANVGTLRLLTPMGLKQADPVPALRNPMRVAPVATGVDPLKGVYKEKNTETTKLRARLNDRVRSVVRGEAALVAIDTRFYRVGDEVIFVSGEKTELPLAGARVILTRIGDNTLTFTVQSTDADGQAPWQSEIEVSLPGFLRRQ